MDDKHVVAWDSKGPIEVEMIVGSAGKTFPIKGSTVIHDIAEPQPESRQESRQTVGNVFAGQKWST